MGMSIREPDIDGFGGSIIFHCKFNSFLDYVSLMRFRGAPIAHVYDMNDNLLSAMDLENFKSSQAGRYAQFNMMRVLTHDNNAGMLRIKTHIPNSVLNRELQNVLNRLGVNIALLSLLLGGLSFCYFTNDNAPYL